MTELLTAGQMRAIEVVAIDEGIATGLELMERAGAGVVDAITQWWPKLAAPVPTAPAAGGEGGAAPSAPAAPSPPEYFRQDDAALQAVVLCGPGNNGGDGFVIARLLVARGWRVAVLFYGDVDALPPDARANYDRWVSDHAVAPLSDQAICAKAGANVVFVDALFGTGLSRPLEGAAFDAQRRLAGLKGPFETGGLVAVDCPSGLCLDSGRPIARGAGAAGLYVPPADLTVTFQTPKLGHYLGDGPAYCGRLHVVDLGIGDVVARAAAGRLEGGIDPEKSNAYARLARAPVGSPSSVARPLGTAVCLSKLVLDHKSNHGHVIVVAGPHGHGGAARLAARAALRVGAGLVTVAAPSDAITEHAARLDAVMLRPVDGAGALAALCKDDRVRSLCIGPGLGLDGRAAELVAVAIESDKLVVLDADALTLVAKDKVLRAKLHAGCVLTPHAGEFARLWPQLDKKMRAIAKIGPAYSKVDAVREAAAECGAQVLLKGPDTVSSHPRGGVIVNAAVYELAAPWLATAGSGDVLAGLIAGLLARGVNTPDAVATAAWLHGACARQFGPGLIAEDLPDALPAVFRQLGI